MKTMLAPLGAFFGLLIALTLGMTGVANATGIDPEFDCSNGIGYVVCDNVNDDPADIKVFISDTNVLSGAQVAALEEAIDDVVIRYGESVTKADIKVAVVSLYHQEFNINLLTSNVYVVGNILCGC
jgi:hypothetical protein